MFSEVIERDQWYEMVQTVPVSYDLVSSIYVIYLFDRTLCPVTGEILNFRLSRVTPYNYLSHGS